MFKANVQIMDSNLKESEEIAQQKSKINNQIQVRFKQSKYIPTQFC